MTHASADRVQTLRTRLRPGKRVLIVGAGISGLSAAYLLKQSCPEAELCVIDRAPRAGGVIQSERTREGLLLETGPDSLVTWKPEAMSLLGQLGLDQRTVVGAERRSWVKLRDRFAPMPDGLQGTLPPSPSAVLRGSLFSYAGKLRMACEPCVPARRDGLEESVQDFVTRRFGAEALDRLVAPLLGGIYACDPAELSARAVLGSYVAQEHEYGSIARAMAHQRRAPRQPGASTRPPVISLDDGMALLTSRLCEELGGVLQLGTAAAQLSRDRRGQLRVTTERGHSLAADAVILACPPGEASRLLRPLAPEAASELGAIDSSSVLHVQLAWPADACPSALKASGYVVAPSAGGALKACTFSSRKWPNRAPSSQITFRCFMRDTELDDAHAVHQAVSSLQSDLQLSAAPSFVHVTRLPAVLPRYRVGHLERVQRIASLLAATPEIQLAGNAYLGPGIPDCIRSAQRAVAPILHALREQCHGHCSARELCGTGTEDSLV